MKSKVIVVVVLSILITALCCFSLGTVLAEEIEISIMEYRSGDLSDDEIDFAISNLQYKLELDNLPRLIRADVIYDLNGEGLYGLYEFKNYYMIVIRQTGSVMERGEGNSVYYRIKSDKKYYGGYGNYFMSSNDGFKNIITSEIVPTNLINDTKEKMKELRELDYQDYLETLSTTMVLGVNDNRNKRLKKLGNKITDLITFIYEDEDYLFNYFYKEINIDYIDKNLNENVEKYHIIWGDIFRSSGNPEIAFFGDYYVKKFGNYYDFLYPENMGNDCALVTMTILLQYYYRTEFYKDVLDDYDDYSNFMAIELKWDPSISQTVKTFTRLSNYIKTLGGAATYVNIDAAFERFFKENDIESKSTHFTSYTNMKKAIDQGLPAIITVGAGKGSDGNKSHDISNHNLVAYGYTTNSIGVLDEFLCHAGWHKSESDDDPKCAQLFVNKFLAAGNVYIHF